METSRRLQRRRWTHASPSLPLLLLYFICTHGAVTASYAGQPFGEPAAATAVLNGSAPLAPALREEELGSGGAFGPARPPSASTEAELLLPGDRLPEEESEEEEPASRGEAPRTAATGDVLRVDFFDPASRGRTLDLAPPPTSSLARELQGGDPTSWAVPDSYDYLTPDEDGVSPTAEEYADATVEGGRSSPARPASPPPDGPRRRAPADGSDGEGGCRPGYRAVNATCRSPCELEPDFCYNGGQCYLLEGVGTFCRCNVQDYIWHKGARCEAVVTEFQVTCLAVGASAVVLLLLFMMVVCFAKKLHLLETENKKLRRRSKYRPTSEAHNDNFSLSTIAEGSHPNVRKLCDTPPNVPHARALAYYDNIICQDDPASQNKLEEALKAPPKEDDALNIRNALTPKHDNHKLLGDDDSEVNSLQNNMM
ncbi:chondroitin sulfate proteoglycan 5-like isoform X2 [Stigmatopora argus]